MSGEDIEAIRQRMISLLVDSNDLKRKVDHIVHGKNQPAQKALLALTDIAARIDRETHELYHLLPEHLRPTELPRSLNPHESRLERSDTRTYPGPTPGGKLPREVRWPNWTIERILELADAFHEKHGKWPNGNSGRVSESSPDTWTGIDLALKRGNRNLPGGITLAQLLAERRGVRNRTNRPKFEIGTILAWADEHHARTGHWPNRTSGAVSAAPEESWPQVDDALRDGLRGIRFKTSLARLLAERRGASYYLDQEALTIEQILQWADAHHLRTGKWPTRNSGDIPEAPQENWSRIDNALVVGNRTLSAGSSLVRLLAERRGMRNRKALPAFKIEQLLLWADRHYERHARWPSLWSGEIEDAPGETWNAVDSAFKVGGRGMAGCGYRSLAHLLDEQRGKLRRRGNKPAERVLPDAQ